LNIIKNKIKYKIRNNFNNILLLQYIYCLLFYILKYKIVC
jgi:hypothetical protein